MTDGRYAGRQPASTPYGHRPNTNDGRSIGGASTGPGKGNDFPFLTSFDTAGHPWELVNTSLRSQGLMAPY